MGDESLNQFYVLLNKLLFIAAKNIAVLISFLTADMFFAGIPKPKPCHQ